MHALLKTAALVGALLIDSTAYAGAWTREPGDAYVKIWNRTLVGKGVLVRPGKTLVLDERYQDHQLQVYSEVGLVERLTWVGYVAPVGFAAYGGNGSVYMGPLYTGARFRLTQGSAGVLSMQATLGGRLPVGDSPRYSAVVDGEQVVVRPTLGTAQADFELQYGRGFGKGWFALDTGARGFSSGAFNPVVFGRAQLGWKPSRRLVTDIHVSTQQSLGTLSQTDVLGVTNTRFVAVGLTGSVWFTEHLAVTGSFEGAAFVTSNAGTPSLNLGVEIK